LPKVVHIASAHVNLVEGIILMHVPMRRQQSSRPTLRMIASRRVHARCCKQGADCHVIRHSCRRRVLRYFNQEKDGHQALANYMTLHDMSTTGRRDLSSNRSHDGPIPPHDSGSIGHHYILTIFSCITTFTPTGPRAQLEVLRSLSLGLRPGLFPPIILGNSAKCDDIFGTLYWETPQSVTFLARSFA
jgi:hypothetical protein